MRLTIIHTVVLRKPGYLAGVASLAGGHLYTIAPESHISSWLLSELQLVAENRAERLAGEAHRVNPTRCNDRARPLNIMKPPTSPSCVHCFLELAPFHTSAVTSL